MQRGFAAGFACPKNAHAGCAICYNRGEDFTTRCSGLSSLYQLQLRVRAAWVLLYAHEMYYTCIVLEITGLWVHSSAAGADRGLLTARRTVSAPGPAAGLSGTLNTWLHHEA
jgi:hypothetical protein